MQTPATQALERLGVAYELREFDAEAFTSEEAAAKLGIPPAQLFKTLVARGERNGVLLALVPATHDLSLRKLARAANDKRAEMVDVAELPRLTGYVKGGVSPLGTRRRYPTYLDRSALDHARISVSAGLRGLQLWLDPNDLLRAAGAEAADLTG